MIWVPLYVVYYIIRGMLNDTNGTLADVSIYFMLIRAISSQILIDITYFSSKLERMLLCLFFILQRFIRTLRKGIKPEFGPGKVEFNTVMLFEKQTKKTELEIENETDRGRGEMNKSPSAMPFLAILPSAEDTSNSTDLYPDLSKDVNETRVI